MKPDLSALHAFPWNEEEDLVFNVHACYGAVSNWGGIICLGLKWLSYKTPAVSWASQEWQGKEGCSEYWGELHCGGCGAKFALASGIWNQVTAVLPSAPAAGGSCPKPSASPLQCVSEVHYHAAQSLMCVFQLRIQKSMSEVLTSLTDLFSFWDWSVTTHTSTVTNYKRSKTKRKQAFGSWTFVSFSSLSCFTIQLSPQATIAMIAQFHQIVFRQFPLYFLTTTV